MNRGGCKDKSSSEVSFMSMYTREIKRGDIFYADLNPARGSEQGGRRPVLIIQNNKGNQHSSTVIVAPITTRLKKLDLPTHVSISAGIGLPANSMVLLEQIRAIDKSRLDRYVTCLDSYLMTKVDDALDISVGRELAEHDEQPDSMTLCLCPICAAQFFNSSEHIIRRINPLNTVKESCTYCQVRSGYDYIITHARKKIGSDRA